MTEMKEANGRKVYEITLGRGEIENASKTGLVIPPRKVREADEIRISVGPDMEFVTVDGLGKLIDQSFRRRQGEKQFTETNNK